MGIVARDELHTFPREDASDSSPANVALRVQSVPRQGGFSEIGRDVLFTQHVLRVSLVRCLAYIAAALASLVSTLAAPMWVADQEAQVRVNPLPPEELIPPPEPLVPPIILAPLELDANRNRIDDLIEEEVAAALALPNAEDRTKALAQPIRIELVFAKQITQDQIDGFLHLGGSIDYIYQSVSYGWNGVLPRGLVDRIREIMGPSLVTVTAERRLKPDLKEATQNGRVRPVWVPGFAGSGSGFSGNANITIAIMDTGVDDTHTDLAGRQEYWKDYTSDNELTPRDIVQHGTHVAGIALGTGAAIGPSPTQLLFTDSGNWSEYGAGYYAPSPIHLPPGAVTWVTTGTWSGGGQSYVRHRNSADGSSTYTTFGSAYGGSGTSLTSLFSASAGYRYTGTVNSNGSNTTWAAVHTVTYSGVGDGFNALRGVAPSCKWAGAKAGLNDGSGLPIQDIGEAMDDMVNQRAAHNIKVVNMSFGGVNNSTMRGKVNTMVNNGIVAVCSTGNNGGAVDITDPGRAAYAITVAASNCRNELTDYTSRGFSDPSASEDYKPDVMAPGGSRYYNYILSVDSNDADAESVSFADQQANDYYNIYGTSMSAPFVAGAAALVIDALQQSGVSWDFSSSDHPLLAKMLLCATATESNKNREVNSGYNPTLGRASAPKDRYEGYGLVNPDAAIEAVMLNYASGTVTGSTDGSYYDRRAWARNVNLFQGLRFAVNLTVPATGDFDLYCYSGTPDSKGNPIILASGTNAGVDLDESISFVAGTTEVAYLVVKRVSGNGEWTLGADPTAVRLAFFTAIGADDGVLVEWGTEAELGTAGFNVLRAESPEGPWVKLNSELIPSRGSSWQGAFYSFSDEDREPGTVCWYCLEEVSVEGSTSRYPSQLVWDDGLSDADGDGMPDVWEQGLGIDTARQEDASTDADGDGATNREEYLAGTSPVDAGDCPRLCIGRQDGGSSAVLSWSGRAGRSYELFAADSLAGLLGGCGCSRLLLAVAQATRDGPMQAEDASWAEERERFYRLIISPPR